MQDGEREEEIDEKIDKSENEEDQNIALETYMKEMDMLSEDFSDLSDFDIEELQDIKEAIEEVRRGKMKEEISEDQTEEAAVSEEISIEDSELMAYLDEREQLSQDFTDIQELDLDELKDMKEAIATIKSETENIEAIEKSEHPISEGLEQKIRLELEKRKEIQKKKEVTVEDFQNYIKDKREKIWYHSLYHLVFGTEDHSALKEGLYDILKETTSKSPFDDIPQQQFYFGLGYLLRLKLYDKDIIRYKGGKFKININVDTLKRILEENGEPISRRPIIPKDEQDKMISDFLKDDFEDI